MRKRYLLAVLAVLVLLLAIWLVPMALAAAGGAPSPSESGSPSPSQTEGTQCPFLQTHPWLDPHNSGGETGTGGASQAVYY